MAERRRKEQEVGYIINGVFFQNSISVYFCKCLFPRDFFSFSFSFFVLFCCALQRSRLCRGDRRIVHVILHSTKNQRCKMPRPFFLDLFCFSCRCWTKGSGEGVNVLFFMAGEQEWGDGGETRCCTCVIPSARLSPALLLFSFTFHLAYSVYFVDAFLVEQQIRYLTTSSSFIFFSLFRLLLACWSKFRYPGACMAENGGAAGPPTSILFYLYCTMRYDVYLWRHL